ncbi:hypothetical protein NPX13_g1951 [Xylaria arbuscula]|uniref:Uncharacterized protein n=1 Tax=Xylaria arbuscula TaxID=114810 RepID=A0A9W8NKI3_9PEZI|nr:hypothetical protein NPX13_g1951 [Xylaria arbuscula]
MAEDSKRIVNYIQSEAARAGSAFSVKSTFDSQKALFMNKRPIYLLSDLQNALFQYQKLNCQPKLKFDPLHCSWQDVYDLLSSTAEAYEAEARGFRGFGRRMLRKTGNNADAIEPALGLIPDTSGISIVIASLAWLLSLAKEAATRRETIFAAFRDVPATIEMAEEERKRFPHDVRLRDLTNELYDTVISGLIKLIQWLLPKHVTVKVFAIIIGLSGGEVDSELERMKTATEDFKQRASQLMKNIHMSTHMKVEQSLRESNAIRFNTVNMSHQLETLQPLPGQIGDLKEDIGSLRKQLELESINMLTSLANHGGLMAQNWMYQLLSEKLCRIEVEMEKRFQEIESRERVCQLVKFAEAEVAAPKGRFTPEVVLSTSEVLSALRFPFQVLTEDLNLAIRNGLQSGLAAHSQARWLLKQDRFWRWFTSTTSDLILLEGLPSPRGMVPDRLSPLSFVCANIIASVIKNYSGAVPLYYFCGLHMSSSDHLYGPQGLIRGVITKLLLEMKTQYPMETANLNLIADGLSLDALYRYDMENLCLLFRHIVKQFPPHLTIYCVVDGILYYEKQDTLGDALIFVQNLLNLVEFSLSTGPIIKVLLATPCPSRHITSLLSAHQRILLGAGLVSDEALAGRMGFANIGFPLPRLSRPEAAEGGIIERPVLGNQEAWTADDYA